MRKSTIEGQSFSLETIDEIEVVENVEICSEMSEIKSLG